MYVPCCSIRAVSTAQATPDQHPEQTQIEQRPDFGNIAKRQTRPSPTQSTFSVDGALPGRRCAILAGSMHSPRLAGQIGGARTEQGRGGGDVRSGRLREPTSTGRARPRQAGGVPASVVRSSPHHGQSLSRMQPGAHRPFERPLRPEDSSAELGLSNSGAAKTFAQGACSQAISTPDARMDDGVATALGRRCCLVRTRQSCPTTASSRAE